MYSAMWGHLMQHWQQESGTMCTRRGNFIQCSAVANCRQSRLSAVHFRSDACDDWVNVSVAVIMGYRVYTVTSAKYNLNKQGNSSSFVSK